MAPRDEALIFFREIVEPAAEEFMAAPAEKRRGVLACLAVAAMTEHFYHAYPALAGQGLATFKADLRKQNAALGWIADIANATKHVQRGERGNRVGYADMASVALNTLDVMRVGWPLSSEEELLVGQNLEWRLTDLISAAMDFWQAKLGITPSGQPSPST